MAAEGGVFRGAFAFRDVADAAMTARTSAAEGLMVAFALGLPLGYHPSWNHWRTMAATAAIAGVAMDVPDMSCTALALQSTLVEDAAGGGLQCTLAELPKLARELDEAIMLPGATTSGFNLPSLVGPTLLK